MSKRIEIRGSSLIVTDTDNGEIVFDEPKRFLYYRRDKLVEEGIIWFYRVDGHVEVSIPIHILLSEAVNKLGIAFTVDSFVAFIKREMGSVDVTLQDSTAPLLLAHLSKLVTETTISVTTAKDDYSINVASATGMVVGQYLTIYNAAANRVFFSTILAINALVITLDTPLDFEFPIGSFVSTGSTNMNVDGSVTPQVFGVRNPTGVSIPLEFDITRITIRCLTSGTNDLSKFGDIVGGITRGIVLRRTDGEYRNIFNAKTNGELKSIFSSFEIQSAIGSQANGFTGIIDIAGASNLGAVIRIGAAEDLEVIVQDDLTTLTILEVLAEGSEVID